MEVPTAEPKLIAEEPSSLESVAPKLTIEVPPPQESVPPDFIVVEARLHKSVAPTPEVIPPGTIPEVTTLIVARILAEDSIAGFLKGCLDESFHLFLGLLKVTF